MGLTGDLLHRLVIVGGEPLRDLAHEPADHQPGEHGEPESHPVVDLALEDPVGEASDAGSRHHECEVGAAMEGCRQVLDAAGADEERAEDRCQHPERSHGEGEDDRLGQERRPGEDQGCVRDRCDQRPGIGLEQVGAHAGHIPHVVTHIVGDDRRVAGVVLRDAGLDLAHQVGAHVGGFGVDPSPDPGEERHRRPPEADRGHDVYPIGLVEEVVEDQEPGADSEQAEPGDGEAHHGATPESNWERGDHAARASRLGGAGVGRGGDAHAYESGEGGESGAGDIGDCSPGTAPLEKGGDEDRHDDDEHGNPGVLPAEEGHRAGADGTGDLGHALVPDRLGEHPAGEVNGEDQSQCGCGQSRVQDGVGHWERTPRGSGSLRASAFPSHSARMFSI